MEKRKTDPLTNKVDEELISAKPSHIKFSKLQGAGNDYIAIDGRGLNLDFSLLSKNMSRPHFGVFSDGIVVVENSEISDIKMRVFNPDGSEAEMSGNGIRIFCKFVGEFSKFLGNFSRFFKIKNPRIRDAWIHQFTLIPIPLFKGDANSISMI